MTIAPQQHKNSLTKPDSRSVRLFTLLGFFILLIWLALAQLLPPSVVPATATATQFSADRALRSLEVIASQPRPMGSPGHTAAREYLVSQIEALGLQPEVQTTTRQGSTRFEVGRVQNVLVRLPGIASTGAIALDGHYDSSSDTNGAADYGSCVVALRETLRALRASPLLQNDVIFRYFGNQDLNTLQSSQGAVYFNVLPNVMVYYPISWVLPLVIAVGLLFLVVLEVDVTVAREAIHHQKQQGQHLSFTGWIVKCIAQAVSEHKSVHALWREK